MTSKSGGAQKPVVGFCSLASCNGCLMQIVNLDGLLVPIADLIEIAEFRLAQRGVWTDRFDILFVEGAVTTESEMEEITELRARTDYLVAIGTCAAIGGIPAGVSEKAVAAGREGADGALAMSQKPVMPRPIKDVVPVDAVIPGCPIDVDEFLHAARVLLAGGIPVAAPGPMCMDCVLEGNECLLEKGQACLGPIIQRGCRAVCPTRGRICEGCRGLALDASLPAFVAAAGRSGVGEAEIERKLRIYNNLALRAGK